MSARSSVSLAPPGRAKRSRILMTLPKPMSSAAAAFARARAGSAISRSSGSGTVRITRSQPCTSPPAQRTAGAPPVSSIADHRAAEAKRHAKPAALGSPESRSRAVAADDAPLRMDARRPSIPRAAPASRRARGRRRRSPRPCARSNGAAASYSWPGKMPAQEIGDGEVVLQAPQRGVQLSLVRIVTVLARESLCRQSSTASPSISCSDSPASRSKRARDRRLAMDEFGAAIGGIAELRRRQRMDAPAAALARLQDRTVLPARASSRAAIRPAAPAPTMTMCSDRCRHLGAVTCPRPADRSGSDSAAATTPPPRSRVLSSVIAVSGARLSLSASVGIEHEGRALGAVDRRAEDQIEFVDQAGAQERAVGDAAALHQQALHAELAIENVQRQRQVDLGLAGEDIGYALAAQPREMRIRHASVSTTTIGSPPISERPQPILPCASSTTP